MTVKEVLSCTIQLWGKSCDGSGVGFQDGIEDILIVWEKYRSSFLSGVYRSRGSKDSFIIVALRKTVRDPVVWRFSTTSLLNVLW